MSVAVGATFISIFSSTLAAYAIERLRCRAWNLSRLSRPALDPVHSAGDGSGSVRTVRQPAGPDPGISDLPGAVLDLALDRLFQVDPV